MELVEGMPVLYKGVSQSFKSMASQVGKTGAFTNVNNDAEQGHAVRTRGVIDKILSDGSLRVLLNDTEEYVWVQADDVEPLDLVTLAGDVLNNKTIDQTIAEMEDYRRNGPESFTSRETPFRRSKLRKRKYQTRCDGCRVVLAAGAIVYKPTSNVGGWQHDALVCLTCVIEARVPFERSDTKDEDQSWSA